MVEPVRAPQAADQAESALKSSSRRKAGKQKGQRTVRVEREMEVFSLTIGAFSDNKLFAIAFFEICGATVFLSYFDTVDIFAENLNDERRRRLYVCFLGGTFHFLFLKGVCIIDLFACPPLHVDNHYFFIKMLSKISENAFQKLVGFYEDTVEFLSEFGVEHKMTSLTNYLDGVKDIANLLVFSGDCFKDISFHSFDELKKAMLTDKKCRERCNSSFVIYPEGVDIRSTRELRGRELKSFDVLPFNLLRECYHFLDLCYRNGFSHRSLDDNEFTTNMMLRMLVDVSLAEVIRACDECKRMSLHGVVCCAICHAIICPACVEQHPHQTAAVADMNQKKMMAIKSHWRRLATHAMLCKTSSCIREKCAIIKIILSHSCEKTGCQSCLEQDSLLLLHASNCIGCDDIRCAQKKALLE